VLKKATPPLEVVVDDVMHEHEMRADRCETLPMERRPFKRRPRPKTSIIDEAARRAYAKRMGKT
jgi:hypothetical protein